jgi:ketosteroid isomerase-like protein
MSANVDLVRSIYASWARGDFSATDWADQEIEWAAIGGPEPSSGAGMRSLHAAWVDFLAAWGDYRVQAEEYRELDSERVLVLMAASARGRRSGLVAESGTKGANVFHVRAGKVTELWIYWDREQALAELGVGE